jgi:hypothetical protein
VGAPVAIPPAAGPVVLERPWRTGDVVVLELQMCHGARSVVPDDLESMLTLSGRVSCWGFIVVSMGAASRRRGL